MEKEKGGGYDYRWYVVHTYSGYENKVKANIEKLVENRNMKDQILDVAVPVQDVVEIKDNKRKTVSRKIYPGYVMIKMDMNDDTWYVVRNTRGVTSFVGPGSKPVPLTAAEVAKMGVESPVKEEIVINFRLGDSVTINAGAFEGSVGTVREINENKHTVTVVLSIFGRETPVDLDFMHITKID